MLNLNSLAQLKSLKSQISDKQEALLKEGLVRGSQGRFGFVSSEEGQQFFLPPDEMAKVFPGDRIQFSETTDDKGKVQAVVEKLLNSDFKTFTGRFQKRGKAQFVEPDVAMFNNWLYLPPDACKDIEDNDWISCEVTRHPFPKGKSQAKIVRKIGQLTDAGFERNYSIEKHQLSHEWPETMSSELALLAEDNIPEMAAQREDMTALPFVTIDSEHTRDMDDALYAEKTATGFNLHIAIADPSAWFGMNTSLDQEAARRGNSLYFPGRSLPMLPPELSISLCSLLEGKDRLALVCILQINEQGNVDNYEFKQALIRSQGKLSYHQVTDFIEGKQDAIKAELAPHMTQLHAVTQLLNQYRHGHNLVMEDRPDFYINMGDNGKVQSITRADRNQAQKLVEEAMLAANLCCARYLNDIGLGIFIQHAGFRTERLGDIKTIIKEQGINYDGELNNAEGYKALIQELNANKPELPIKSLFSRFLTRSEFGDSAKPHAGMGFDCYTTFTSPIRKYSDLVIHRIINAHLNEQKKPQVSEQLIEKMQSSLIQGRNAVAQAEQWLKLQYINHQLESLTDGNKSLQLKGIISQINPGGFMVQLDDFGIDGFVDMRKSKPQSQFDKTYLTHKNEKASYQLDQAVNVSIKLVDLMKRKLELVVI